VIEGADQGVDLRHGLSGVFGHVACRISQNRGAQCALYILNVIPDSLNLSVHSRPSPVQGPGARADSTSVYAVYWPSSPCRSPSIDHPINRYTVRVRAHQTDLNGAMYHGAFFDIFDDARIETFRRLSYDYQRMQDTGLRPVIRHVDAEYHAPAFMDDLLTVDVQVRAMTAASMTLRYSCRRGETPIATGHAQFVFVDGRGRPARVPDDLRSVVQSAPEFVA
jgi:acyl-CoA thioester hydrolase